MNAEIIERNMDLVTTVTDYILQHPAMLDHLPADFQLVILPEDDPELSQYNLNLLTEQPEPDKPVIIVRLAVQRLNFKSTPPQVYVPLAV
jgi:hypothetical protein